MSSVCLNFEWLRALGALFGGLAGGFRTEGKRAFKRSSKPLQVPVKAPRPLHVGATQVWDDTELECLGPKVWSGLRLCRFWIIAMQV